MATSAMRSVMQFIIALTFASVAWTDKTEDLVKSLPGFPDAAKWGFKVYSGYLDVPGPLLGYDSLRIHYQFHTSQRDPATDPIASWHQGGPGGSSINVGLYGEMGAFQVGDKQHGNYINPFAWNKVANMLYMESPAGSGGPAGFSQCVKGGKVVGCSFDDKTQAVAYAHALQTFFKDFPEYAKHDFYLSGESYFGQFGPNIAHYLLNTKPFDSTVNLKGIAAGNACWGGTNTCVACNGPSQDKLDVDLFFGKGLFSPKLKTKIYKACSFPTTYSPHDQGGPFDCDAGRTLSSQCRDLLSQMRTEVGPHNVYNIYDNCPNTAGFLERTGKSMGWLVGFLRNGLHNASATSHALLKMNGGYDWDCGGDVSGWIGSAVVREALHLGASFGSSLSYTCSGPASITLWPELAQKIRVLIYNGDADACVPYNGNEDWIGGLEQQGIISETAPWTPWYTSKNASSPAGYITKYQAPGTDLDFSFATIRLAGHMAPTFQPQAALVMFSNFLSGPIKTDKVVV